MRAGADGGEALGQGRLFERCEKRVRFVRFNFALRLLPLLPLRIRIHQRADHALTGRAAALGRALEEVEAAAAHAPISGLPEIGSKARKSAIADLR